MKKYDAIIIGAGQAGVPLAKKISSKGLKVALVEQREIGGTCINDGCSPSKTMVASARVAHLVSRAEEFGIHVPEYAIDQKAIKERKDYIVHLFREGAESGLKNAENIDIYKGSGKFKTDKIITVSSPNGITYELQGDKIFINTGAEPVIPDMDGLDQVPYLTSTTIMELEETPEHLIILGGGYIGLEFGQMFRRFGSKVTILDKGPRLVPKEDEDVCEEISNFFNTAQIKTLFNVTAKKAREENGTVTLYYEDKTGHHHISGSHLLIAVGRAPSTRHMGLDLIGVRKSNSGHVEVNDHFESSVKDIFALGDVAGSPPFTHIAFHDGQLVFDYVYEGQKNSKRDRMVPYCIYTDPQLARIGLNEKQAKEKGITYKMGKYWMKQAARALETNEKNGFFKVLIDPVTKKILGATILSLDGGEILAVIQMAMLGGITYDVIKALPIAHPTLAESLNNLMMAVES